MAAFTTTALAVGLVGGMLLSKARNKGSQQASTAPGPVSEPAAITPPKPPIVNPGEVQAAANTAKQAQRRRAASGSLLTAPTPPKSNTMPVGSRTQPKSLLGS